MAINPNDDRVRLSNPKPLRSAQMDDERHRFHTEAATTAANASPYFGRWKKDVIQKTIPSKSKQKQFLSLLPWPPVTVPLVDEIIDVAGQVHNAQDRFIKIDLATPELEADATEYFERINLQGFIQKNCHNRLFSGPNSLVVVDLPAVQTTAFPEPYVYLVPSANIIAAEPMNGANEAGLLKYAFFKTDTEGIYALFDDVDYSLWEKEKGEATYKQIGSFVPHGLGMCPAFKLWADVEETNPLTSNTILRPLLGMLDRLVTIDTARECNDLAAGFPMFWHLETAKSDAPINDGLLEDAEDMNTLIRPTGFINGNQPYRSLNPTCEPGGGGDRTLFGFGTRIPVPAPQDKDSANWGIPAGWIAPDVASLKYVSEKVVSIRAEIFKSATGYEAPINNEAVNKEQVMSIVERSRYIYNYLAENNEILTKRIYVCMLMLRYGPSYRDFRNSLGRRFTLLSGDELALLYQAAKTAGVGSWLLEELIRLQQEYYAHGDASRLLRFKMLRDLDVYSDSSAGELISLGMQNLDPIGFAVNVGLLGYVARFERENGLSIEEFGNAPDYSKRIETILKRFESYAAERKSIDPETTGPNAPGSKGGKGTKGKPKTKPAGKGSGAGDPEK